MNCEALHLLAVPSCQIQGEQESLAPSSWRSSNCSSAMMITLYGKRSESNIYCERFSDGTSSAGQLWMSETVMTVSSRTHLQNLSRRHSAQWIRGANTILFFVRSEKYGVGPSSLLRENLGASSSCILFGGGWDDTNRLSTASQLLSFSLTCNTVECFPSSAASWLVAADFAFDL